MKRFARKRQRAATWQEMTFIKDAFWGEDEMRRAIPSSASKLRQ
jgi:hypothetical protein